LNNLDLQFDLCATAGFGQSDRALLQFQGAEPEVKTIQTDHSGARKDLAFDKITTTPLIILISIHFLN
jgi:hypothetical protein